MKRKFEDTFSESERLSKIQKTEHLIDYFELICEFARACDADALKKLLKSTCIDVWKKNTYKFSAITQMALEGLQESVDLLLSLGANINYAAKGFALAKNNMRCNQLIAKDADVNEIACSAAEAEDFVYAESLNANINYSLMGAGMAYKGCKLSILDSLEKIETSSGDQYIITGDDIYYMRSSFIAPLKLTVPEEQLNEFKTFASTIKKTRPATDDDLGKIKSFTQHIPESFAYAMKCLEQGGSILYYYMGRAKGGHLNPEILTQYLFDKEEIYAVMRFDTLEKRQIEHLLRSYKINKTQIAESAILYGNFDFACQFIAAGASVRNVIEYAGIAGRRAYIKKLSEENQFNDFRDNASYGYAKGGHAHVMEFLTERNANMLTSCASANGHMILAKSFETSSKYLLWGAAAGGHDWIIERYDNLTPKRCNDLIFYASRHSHDLCAENLIGKFPDDYVHKIYAVNGAAMGSNARYYAKLENAGVATEEAIKHIPMRADDSFVQFIIQRSLKKMALMAESNHSEKDELIRLKKKQLISFIKNLVREKASTGSLSTPLQKIIHLVSYSPGIIKIFASTKPDFFSEDCFLSHKVIKENRYQYILDRKEGKISFSCFGKKPVSLTFIDEQHRTKFFKKFSFKPDQEALESHLMLIRFCTNHSFSGILQDQAIAIRKLVDFGYDFHIAYLMMRPEYAGLRFLLMAFMMPNTQKESKINWLPLDLWCLILSQVVPDAYLNRDDCQSIAVESMKTVLKIQVEHVLPEKSYRNYRFFETISLTKSCETMKKCIASEAERVKEDADSYSNLIASWNFKMS